MVTEPSDGNMTFLRFFFGVTKKIIVWKAVLVLINSIKIYDSQNMYIYMYLYVYLYSYLYMYIGSYTYIYRYTYISIFCIHVYFVTFGL